MILLFFAIQTILLARLYSLFGLKNAVFLIYLIVYFYCNAIVIDLFLLLDDQFYNEFIIINRDNMAFSKVILVYTLFLVTYYMLFASSKENYKIKYTVHQVSRIHNILIALSCIVMLYYILQNIVLTRSEIKEVSNIVSTTILFLISYYWAFLIFCLKKVSTTRLLLFSSFFLLYSIFTYEREPIIFIILALLIKFKDRINFKYFVPISMVTVYVIFYYKAFYQILLVDYNFTDFMLYVEAHPISLARMDPSASFALLYDYFDTYPLLYYDYNFTYITAFTDQINLFFGGDQVESMSKVVSKHYVGDSYGLAYSMILESMINFWYFGPIFLAIATKTIYSYLKRKFFYLNEVIDLMCIMFFLSFVRTELIVMSKIFIFPMIIFLVLCGIYYRKNKTKIFTESNGPSN